MGLNRDGPGLSEMGVIYLETKMVSVLHKELEYKVEKLKFKKLEIIIASLWRENLSRDLRTELCTRVLELCSRLES